MIRMIQLAIVGPTFFDFSSLARGGQPQWGPLIFWLVSSFVLGVVGFKEYLQRRDQLAPEPAHSLAAQIAEQIAAKLGLESADEGAEGFLARVGSALEQRGRR